LKRAGIWELTGRASLTIGFFLDVVGGPFVTVERLPDPVRALRAGGVDLLRHGPTSGPDPAPVPATNPNLPVRR
jgi:hypothetical protein